MSILLEALRKSEKNQHLREAPSIHTESQSDPVSESLPMGLLVILLVAALFVSGWFAWNQYQPPAGTYQPPVTLAVDQVSVAPEPVVTDQNDGEVAAPGPKVSVSAGQKRTPMESYESRVVSEGLSKPGVQAPAKEDTNTSSGQETSNSQLTFKPTSNRGPNQTRFKPAASDEPVSGAAKKYHPGEPAPIGYWELPDSVRSEVPEIKFSVLVYAANPADRFVLINGQRLGEGDSAQPGLEVREIRRDGVIFSYRLYQFLVKR